MADVFISYASEDRELAAALAGKLTSRGYSVWWDHHPVAGSQFRDVIHEQLKVSKVVLVVWTANSVKSTWVMCGRRPRCKRILAFGLRSGASHVSGLFARHTTAGPDVIR